MSAEGHVVTRPGTDRVVAGVIQWLETGVAPEGLLADDCFADLTVPLWRVQAGSAPDLLALRRSVHGFPGQVHVHRVDRTDHGFTMEFVERWQHEGQRWYAREMLRADVVDDRIVDMAIYCTGDWDEELQERHRRDVRLIRP
jgi:hypothetical protein